MKTPLSFLSGLPKLTHGLTAALRGHQGPYPVNGAPPQVAPLQIHPSQLDCDLSPPAPARWRNDRIDRLEPMKSLPYRVTKHSAGRVGFGPIRWNARSASA